MRHLYLLHVDSLWPQAGYEQVLATLVYLVIITGIIGYLLQAKTPGKLTRNEHEVLFERIPDALAEISEEARQQVIAATEKLDSETLARFYDESLAWYLRRPHFVINQLLGGHPEFSDGYPHQRPQTLYFNHQKHLGEYFAQDKWLDKPNRDRELGEKAAKDCTVCHAVEEASRDVKPRRYEKMCAGCHEQQITDRQMIAMTVEEVSPILLGLGDEQANSKNSEQDPEELAATLLARMAEEGLRPLTELSGEDAMLLWKGMNALEIQKAASGWLEEEDYEALMEEQQSMSGWHVGETEDGDQAVFYRAAGHADPILKGWIETYISKAQTGDETAAEALEILLDAKQGPGGCGKCHASGVSAGLKDGAAEAATLQWAYERNQKSDHSRYSHAPHINLMGDKVGCDNCHKLAKDADFDAYFEADLNESMVWTSGFNSIEKQTCQTCHSEGKISASCLTCHNYHNNPGFRLGFMDNTEADSQ